MKKKRQKRILQRIIQIMIIQKYTSTMTGKTKKLDKTGCQLLLVHFIKLWTRHTPHSYSRQKHNIFFRDHSRTMLFYCQSMIVWVDKWANKHCHHMTYQTFFWFLTRIYSISRSIYVRFFHISPHTMSMLRFMTTGFVPQNFPNFAYSFNFYGLIALFKSVSLRNLSKKLRKLTVLLFEQWLIFRN